VVTTLTRNGARNEVHHWIDRAFGCHFSLCLCASISFFTYQTPWFVYQLEKLTGPAIYSCAGTTAAIAVDDESERDWGEGANMHEVATERQAACQML
jgi:hypothetical protein